MIALKLLLAGTFIFGDAAHTSIFLDSYNIPLVSPAGAESDKAAARCYDPVKGVWKTTGNNGFTSGKVIAENSRSFTAYTVKLQNFDCEVEITAQPVNMSTCKDTNAEFRVAAGGTNNSYQWQVNEGSGFKDLRGNSTYSGVNANVLSISNAPLSFNGYKYRCLVSGSCEALSNEATLGVYDFAPSFTAGEALPAAGEQNIYVQKLAVTGGVPPYTFNMTSGSLPAGLSLSFDGKLAGKPEKESAGNYTFTVLLTESSPCRNTSLATFTLKVNVITADMVDVHPVITPNGDGINDFLAIPGIESYPENHVVFFNRNGAIVCDIKQYDNQQKVFKGATTYGMDFLPAGTYYYMLEFKDKEKRKRKTGYLVLKY
jgi:gliding motility-associated-like protein